MASISIPWKRHIMEKANDRNTMMNRMWHVTDLLDIYVLGALEADEMAEVDAHLDTCPSCRAQAEIARATAQQLLFSAPLVAPPVSLKAKMLARVRAAAASDRAMSDAIAPTPAAAAPSAPATGAISRRRNLLRRMLDTMMGEDQLRADDPVAALLIRLLSEPACEVWSVGATKDAPKNAAARFIGVPNDREGVFITSGLPGLAVDQEYQIWLLHNGKPEPNALFSVTKGGRGQQIVQAPSRLRDFEVVAVTPEPVGGSPAPTGPIVLMGALGK
jgi:anti-sigma-K factor RskA